MSRLNLPLELVDVLGLVALALLAIGVAGYDVRAAFIVVGGLLLLYALLASRHQSGGAA